MTRWFGGLSLNKLPPDEMVRGLSLDKLPPEMRLAAEALIAQHDAMFPAVAQVRASIRVAAAATEQEG